VSPASHFRCPKCEREDLTLLDHPPGVATCRACGGMFVPPRRMQGFIEEAETLPVGETQSDYDEKTGRCPDDGTIMTRARIELPSSEKALHLERCGACKSVWFDAGEWQALAHEHLLEHLDEIWTAEWRSTQRHDREQREAEQRSREAFGDELFGKLTELAQTLRDHPRRSQALAFLREESGR